MSSQFPKIGFVFRTTPYSTKPVQDRDLLVKIMRSTKVAAETIVLDSTNIGLKIPCSDYTRDFDVVCSMSRDPAMLSLLSAYEILGVSVLNSIRSVWIANNKPSIFTLISKGGVPVPSTEFKYGVSGTRNSNLVLKGHRGDFRVFSKTTILKGKWDLYQVEPNTLNIIQDFVKAKLEIKAYVIGKEVFLKNVRNRRYSSSLRSVSEQLLSDIKDAVVRVGMLSRLEIYNVDILVNDCQFCIVDINDFPSFQGIAGAPEKISNYLIQKMTCCNGG